MERKRKLPARAAARVEHIAKKRTATPPEHRSPTPTPGPAEEPPPPLPKSVQAGKPLPTVDDAQPEELPVQEYQSVQESGVLAESLHRSRQKWITEGIFEKYWTKPHKRKGTTIEEPNNPPKDSMSKIGQVTITIEPHVFEATMWAIKDPKPPTAPAPTTTATFRPILQYGPPNGVMPPPPTPPPPPPSATPPVNAQPAAPDPKTGNAKPSPALPSPVVAQQPQSRPQSSAANEPPKVAPSPRGMESVLSPSPSQAPRPAPSASPLAAAPTAPNTAVASAPPPPRPGSRPTSAKPMQTTAPPKPAGPPKTPGADPIIMTLAERASEDPQLRDLMKRVAAGEAKPDELSNFQKIIDRITTEYKQKGGQQGPSADRLLVDGRTVKYFADEVRTILDIVLASNPKQRSSELRPPPGSDALVVLLVKAALDDQNTKGMIRRIAEGQPNFTDATDLKAVLDKLHKETKGLQTPQAQPQAQQQTPGPSQAQTSGQSQPSPTQPVANGAPNGHPTPLAPATPAPQTQQPPTQQALRSKGPPPAAPKPDISAIALDFAGGTGDRYLFPKFSILEHLPGNQQVIASFLIVRKGSTSEYGGDPQLDYYQPITIRLYSHSGRHLDLLSKVVAPPDEVRRYMDDVMDNMTRAEYVLLAMRLPRVEKAADEDSNSKEAKEAKESAPAKAPLALPELAPQKKGTTSARLEVNWGSEALREFQKLFPRKETYSDWTAAQASRSRQPTKSRPPTEEEVVYRHAREQSSLPGDLWDFPAYEKLIQSLAKKARAEDTS